jgi:hypothetical protein
MKGLGERLPRFRQKDAAKTQTLVNFEPTTSNFEPTGGFGIYPFGIFLRFAISDLGFLSGVTARLKERARGVLTFPERAEPKKSFPRTNFLGRIQHGRFPKQHQPRQPTPRQLRKRDPASRGRNETDLTNQTKPETKPAKFLDRCSAIRRTA